MQLKLVLVVNSIPSLLQLGQVKTLSAKISYNLSRTVKDCLEKANSFEETRLKRVSELAEKDENGQAIREENGNFKLSDDAMASLSDEITALAEQEVEIYCTPIKISEIENVTGLTEDVFRKLFWLFSE